MPPSADFDGRGRHVGYRQQVVRIVPDLLLCLEREKCRHPAETDRKRPAPSGAAAGAAKFEADLRQLGRTIFVTAETLRLHHAKNIRIPQRIHRLGWHAPGLFGTEGTRRNVRSKLADSCNDVGEFGPRCQRVNRGGAFRFLLHIRLLPESVPFVTVRNTAQVSTLGNGDSIAALRRARGLIRCRRNGSIQDIVIAAERRLRERTIATGFYFLSGFDCDGFGRPRPEDGFDCVSAAHPLRNTDTASSTV